MNIPLRIDLDSFFDYLHLTDKYKIKFANLKGQAMRFTKGMKGGSKIRSKITFTTNIEGIRKNYEKCIFGLSLIYFRK